MHNLDFSDLKIIEIPVTYESKQYMLIEASGDSVARFNNARSKCVTMEDGGVTSVEGVGYLDLLIVSLCLYPIKDDNTVNRESPVSMGILKRWPERVIKPIAKAAKEISEIDADDDLDSLKEQHNKLGERIAKMEEDAAKNEQTSTETGSS